MRADLWASGLGHRGLLRVSLEKGVREHVSHRGPSLESKDSETH